MIQILLVEDEEAHVELVSRSFEKFSDRFLITVVSNLKNAKILIQREPPDLIITDLILPDGEGTDLLIFNPDGLYLPLIVMTSHGNEQSAVQAIKKGALDYFVKSVDTFSDLPRIGERVLREWRHIIERKLAEVALRKSELRLNEAQRVAHVGSWELDVITHELWWSDETYCIFGYAKGEFGNTMEAFFETIHSDDQKFMQKVTEASWYDEKPFDADHRIILPNGEVRMVHEQAEVTFDESGQPIKMIGTVQDITEHKQAEEQIKASLKEKETLLQEIHHRVKNNMNVVSSLLKLQANNIDDQQTKGILKDSQNRIFALSAIHETIHESEKLSEIDLKKYLFKISTSVFQSSSVDPEKVKLRTDIEEVPISINQASPLGLTINELISNSLKYAFPDEKEGEINVSMKKQDKEIELIVMDDGVGIPEELDWKNSKSLGLKLVRTLVENQLDGSIDLDNTNGTKFTIKFNIET